MLIGILIGIGIMVFGILCFAIGYGLADQKHNNQTDDEKEQ